MAASFHGGTVAEPVRFPRRWYNLYMDLDNGSFWKKGNRGCRMATLWKAVTALALSLVMGGCGVHWQAHGTDVAGYPYRHADFDYRYAWKAATTDQGIVIDGVMKNVRYPYIDSITLTVDLLDRDGKSRAVASDFPRPQVTREGDVSRFGLVLKGVRPAAGDSFRFTVRYTGNEGNDQKINWISIFTADALTGNVIPPPDKSPDIW